MDYFDWLKIIHLVFIISWMAGLLYLPRFFVHYVEAKQSDEQVSRLVKMAGNLYKFTTIIMMIAITTGIIFWIAYFPIALGWLHAKVSFVALLLAYHIWCKFQVKKMKKDIILNHSSIFYRWANEVPLILLVVILILVVIKPF